MIKLWLWVALCITFFISSSLFCVLCSRCRDHFVIYFEPHTHILTHIQLFAIRESQRIDAIFYFASVCYCFMLSQFPNEYFQMYGHFIGRVAILRSVFRFGLPFGIVLFNRRKWTESDRNENVKVRGREIKPYLRHNDCT